VIEVAEELVEAVRGRQELVAIAEVVLAELARRVTQRLQRLGNRDVLLLQPFLGPGDADLQQPRAEPDLAGDERGPPGGAAVLGVVVREQHAFLGDPIDVRRVVADDAERVGADVGLAHVVSEDDEDVGLPSARRLCRSNLGGSCTVGCRHQRDAPSAGSANRTRRLHVGRTCREDGVRDRDSPR
jgi:hypothetical protein